MKEKLHQIQYGLFEYLKEKAYSFEKDQRSEQLEEALRDQKVFSSRDFSPSDNKEISKAIFDSRVTYLGDFHTFDQSSRNMKRILEILTSFDKEIIIGVELVQVDAQESLDNYLNRYITEFEFLEEINYRESWRFPWTHYRPFFQLARENRFKLVALNSEGTLSERDTRAANICANLLESNPNSTLIVLFGELHIMPNRIPAKVQSFSSEEDIRQVIIHQNLDEVFWNDQGNGKSKNRIVKFNEREFSLQTSTPWLKYESMVYWYESLCEDPEFDLHDALLETGALNLNSSAIDNFYYLVEKISTLLNQELTDDLISDFNIFDATKIELVLSKIANEKPIREVSFFYKRLIETRQSFRLPRSNNYYCSNYSINRLAHLAGVHLYTVKCPIENESKIVGREPFHFFALSFYQNLVGYLSSKLINPYRKCDHYQDIYNRSLAPNLIPSNRRGLELAIDLLKLRQTTLITDTYSRYALFRTAKELGYFCGDIFHDQFLIQDSDACERVLELLFKEKRSRKNFIEILDILLPIESYRETKKYFF